MDAVGGWMTNFGKRWAVICVTLPSAVDRRRVWAAIDWHALSGGPSNSYQPKEHENRKGRHQAPGQAKGAVTDSALQRESDYDAGRMQQSSSQ